MARGKGRRPEGGIGWTEACDLLEDALEGPTRREIVERALESGDVGEALLRLRAGMRSHLFSTSSALVPLKPIVRHLDRRTRKDGFRILHDWDGRTERFNKEIIPVDMLNYAARLQDAGRCGPEALPLLLDYYFLHVLALLVMRAWDEGDANENLDRVSHLLGALQGPDGSGLRLVGDAETLLWIAISNYQPDDLAYDRLLEKVRTLDEEHRMAFALIGAGVLGSHLRWGFEAYYERDLMLLRRDNFADYPWLLFSLETLVRAYARMHRDGVEGAERERVVGALLNGLTADVPAFTGEAPGALSEYREEHAAFARLYRRHRDDLLAEFARHRPGEGTYSPIGFHFNFPHNVLKARVGMALNGEEAPNLPLNALLGVGPGAASDELGALAEALTDRSRRSPEHIGERRVMVIGYNLKVATMTYRTVLWDDRGQSLEAEAAAEHPAGDADAGGERLRLSPYQRGRGGRAGAGAATGGASDR